MTMAGSEALYQFLTTRLKQHELPVESLPKVLGISRSTLYRNMKGTAHMLPKVRDKFVEMLTLNEDEQQEFDRLLGLASFDATLLQARDIIDRFVFPGQRPAETTKPESLRFALYDRDVFLRTSDQIYSQIREMAVAPGASTIVRIIDCTSKQWFASVEWLVEDLLDNVADVTVEHLLTLSQTDYAATATMFTRLLPLLRFGQYRVHYSEPCDGDARQILGHVMSVEVRHPDGTFTAFVLSFVEDDLCTCLLTSDASVIGFFHSNFDAAKKGYSEALVQATDMDGFSDAMADMEESTDVYIVKPDFCFESVPQEVYYSVMARCDAEDLAHIQQKLAGADGDPASSVEMVLGTLERRAQASVAHRHIDVCSVAGLEELARTGRLSDHIDFLPSFNEAERAAIFERARKRNNDEHDSYTLYVVRDDMLPGGHIAIVLEGIGVMMEYNPEDYQRGLLSNLLIENKAVAEIFSDYVRNHIPDTRALSKEETDAFLTSLIEGLKN